MNACIEIVSAGILSTIQDAGRKGFQGSGFQVSGCMDMHAYHDANALVNNPLDMPVIEMLFMGIKAIFRTNTYFAVTGARAPIKLNGKEIHSYCTYMAHYGDELEIGAASSGRFLYLAIAGGFDLPRVMGSFSTNLKCKIGGFHGRALAAGDCIGIEEYCGFFPNLYLKKMPVPGYIESGDETLLHVIAGPQISYFTDRGIDTFSTQSYCVTNESDRMGYRIEGPEIEYKDSVDILSDGIVFGSIQVPSSGKPMILMADRQTTGGYAKIATVISADLPKLAQCMPERKLRFCFVSMKEARKRNKRYDKELKSFRRKCGYYLNRRDAK